MGLRAFAPGAAETEDRKQPAASVATAAVRRVRRTMARTSASGGISGLAVMI